MVPAEFRHRPDDRAYHHGNLRAALVDAGVELARAGGPAAIQLRAVSRAAGVSHNAAYRHFANQEDLVAAVGARCMAKLGELMAERTEQVRARGAIPRARARLRAIGRAYIEFARAEPGWFRTAFSSARAHPAEGPTAASTVSDVAGTPADAESAATDPFSLLNARLDELVQAGALPAAHRPGAEYAAWSAVHGLSSLLLDGPLRQLPEPEVERAMDAVLGVVNRGLD